MWHSSEHIINGKVGVYLERFEDADGFNNDVDRPIVVDPDSYEGDGNLTVEQARELATALLKAIEMAEERS